MSAGKSFPSSRVLRLTVTLVAIACAFVSAQSPELPRKFVVKIIGATLGSGIVVAVDGDVATVLTAFHVIQGEEPFQVKFAAAENHPTVAVKRADVFGLQADDQINGLAVFSVRETPPGVEPAVFEDGVTFSSGVEVVYWGYPGAANSVRSFTGNYSGSDGNLLLMSPSVGEGASGGPVTRNGRVVGVVTSKDAQSTHAVIADAAIVMLKGWNVRFRAEPPETAIPRATNEALDADCDMGRTAACYALGARYLESGAAMGHARAVSLFQRTCESGDARGCTELARLYRDGRAVGRDLKQAVGLFRRGCDGGDPRGCADLGWMYAEVRGVEHDDSQAVAFYRRGCDGGDPRGCENLGSMYERGRGVAADDAEAVGHYERSCKAGHARGCTEWGRMHNLGRGAAHDVARANMLFQRGCEGGDARGCTYWGQLVGDRDTAVTLYQRGCEGGHGAGCTEWGRLLEPSDKAQALERYERGCKADDAKGCHLSAQLKDVGWQGVKRDRKAAFQGYSRACSLNDAEACTEAGRRLADGDGIDRNLRLARSYYSRSCDGGDFWGCFHEAEMYEQGRGVARDRTRALERYRQACDLGNPSACEAVKRLNGR